MIRFSVRGSRRTRSRLGFTLLETMLALSLSALLLAAIYAAIDQSWRTAASGREEMERAQLARALIHKIEVDIRAITFVPPKPVEETAEAGTTTTGSGAGATAGGGSTGSGGSGGSTGANTSNRGNSTGGTGNTGGGGSNSGGGRSSGGTTGGGASGGGGSTSRSGSSSGSGMSGVSGGSRSGGSATGGSTSSSSSGAGFGGLAGTNTSATGTTGSTDSTEESTEPVEPNSKSVGIRGTSQKFEISISRPRRDLLPGTAAVQTSSRTSDLRQVSYSFLPTGSTPAGLIRTEGDRMAVETMEASGGVGTQISSMQMLAPEVSAFRVRYFDGRTWSEAWDTDTMGRIPRAVEISIGFAPPKKKPPIFSAPVSRSMDSFRTVILIPVSDPYPQDFVQ